MKRTSILAGASVVLVAGVWANVCRADMVAYWPLDGNVNDASGKGNHGTIYGTPTYVPGRFGQALSFDGGMSYVNVGDDISLKPTQNITIALWIKPGETQNTLADILGGHENNQGYVIQQDWYNTNTYYFAYNRNGTQYGWQGDNITTQLTAGQWQEFVVQKDGSTIRHYVDGVLTAEGPVVGDIVYKEGNDFYLGLGLFPASGRYFTGILDEVRIWNEVVYPSVVPLPGGLLLGALGLGVAGWRLRRQEVGDKIGAKGQPSTGCCPKGG